MAVHAIVLFCDFRKMIALEIEGLGHPEDIARTIFDTELTALAPIFDYGYPPPRDLDGLQVKGNTPVFHSEILSFCEVAKSSWVPGWERKSAVDFLRPGSFRRLTPIVVNLTGNPWILQISRLSVSELFLV